MCQLQPIGQTSEKVSGPVVVAQDVRHSYDGKSFALDGVSFEIRKGEVF